MLSVMEKADSILEIHEVEEKARAVKEKVEKEKERMSIETRDKASKIITDAQENAKTILEYSIEQANLEVAKIKKKKIEEAEKKAKKISSTKISKEKAKKAVSEFISEIL